MADRISGPPCNLKFPSGSSDLGHRLMTKCCYAKATSVHMLNILVIPLWIGVMDAERNGEFCVPPISCIPFTRTNGTQTQSVKVMAVSRAGHCSQLGLYAGLITFYPYWLKKMSMSSQWTLSNEIFFFFFDYNIYNLVTAVWHFNGWWHLSLCFFIHVK